jgi:hypothetical protein
MQIIRTIPQMDAKAMSALEANARRALSQASDKRRLEAEAVLQAIDVERARRAAEENDRRRVSKESIWAKVQDLGLFDRVVMAFGEMPPTDKDVTVLKAIAQVPGRDHHFLAHYLGKRDGGYINLAVGTMCSDREHYLAAPLSRIRKGKDFYSSLLIDMPQHVEPDGRKWHSWTLKPEAEAALQHLGILAREF